MTRVALVLIVVAVAAAALWRPAPRDYSPFVTPPAPDDSIRRAQK